MLPFIIDWVQSLRSGVLAYPGRILEIGSKNINGSVRQCFDSYLDYVGIDSEPGDGVDLVLDGKDILDNFDAKSFDTVICCETFEHMPEFWKTLEAIHGVLKPGGLFLVTTPSITFPYHAFPVDVYRFTHDTYRLVFFKDMEILELKEWGNVIGGIARKGLV
jgi:SAM-dependent methyltransferase